MNVSYEEKEFDGICYGYLLFKLLLRLLFVRESEICIREVEIYVLVI